MEFTPSVKKKNTKGVDQESRQGGLDASRTISPQDEQLSPGCVVATNALVHESLHEFLAPGMANDPNDKTSFVGQGGMVVRELNDMQSSRATPT
jgi:hypothetical protein